MSRNRGLACGVGVFVCAVALGLDAGGAPSQRIQVEQRGDFVLFGNTLGQDCAPAVPAPVVGTVGPCGPFVGDSSPDVFWSSSDATASAQAHASIGLIDAATTAVLDLPAGASVTHAFLYWGARRNGVDADLGAFIERPGGASLAVAAVASYAVDAGGGEAHYQAVADVTAFVAAEGAGPFRVGGVDAIDFVGQNEFVAFASWSMVVLYEMDTQPLRSLTVFDGLDLVDAQTPQAASLAGFSVPDSGFDGKLGVIAYEGDAGSSGDSLSFGVAPLDASDLLGDAANPADNFFNSTRSAAGGPASLIGDLPMLTGDAGSMSGLDLDIVDLTPKLAAGQDSADIAATSAGDVYLLGAFVTSIATLAPTFADSTKTFEDLDGGALLVGDVLAVSIDVHNTGFDTAVDVVVTDDLPAALVFVPGSLSIDSGPNQGPVTDAEGDDVGEYDGAAHRTIVRLGVGAGAAAGGSLAPGASSAITFHTIVAPEARGTTVENQALVSGSGALGAPLRSSPTDGNGRAPGTPPTQAVIDACERDADCPPSSPDCLTATDPNECVACGIVEPCPPLRPAPGEAGTGGAPVEEVGGAPSGAGPAASYVGNGLLCAGPSWSEGRLGRMDWLVVAIAIAGCGRWRRRRARYLRTVTVGSDRQRRRIEPTPSRPFTAQQPAYESRRGRHARCRRASRMKHPPGSEGSPPVHDDIRRTHPTPLANRAAGARLLGERLAGDYYVESVIGLGTLGRVYRARQAMLDRHVAIKTLHPHLSCDRELVAQFKQEARLCSQLSHPNCVRVVDFGAHKGQLYMVLELLLGPNLGAVLASSRPPAAAALEIVLQILGGLDEAHAHHIVHRDIKPSNVILEPQRRGPPLVKVVDFGLALLASSPSATLNRPPIGSPHYVAPEQARGARPDPRADLFSVAVVLYEMLAGVHPFPERTFADLLDVGRSTKPPRLDEVAVVPAGLADVVHRGLSEGPADRWSSAAEFADALRAHHAAFG